MTTVTVLYFRQRRHQNRILYFPVTLGILPQQTGKSAVTAEYKPEQAVEQCLLGSIALATPFSS